MRRLRSASASMMFRCLCSRRRGCWDTARRPRLGRRSRGADRALPWRAVWRGHRGQRRSSMSCVRWRRAATAGSWCVVGTAGRSCLLGRRGLGRVSCPGGRWSSRGLYGRNARRRSPLTPALPWRRSRGRSAVSSGRASSAAAVSRMVPRRSHTVVSGNPPGRSRRAREIGSCARRACLAGVSRAQARCRLHLGRGRSASLLTSKHPARVESHGCRCRGRRARRLRTLVVACDTPARTGPAPTWRRGARAWHKCAIAFATLRLGGVG
jgi:hypothetical protein